MEKVKGSEYFLNVLYNGLLKKLKNQVYKLHI